MTLRRRIPFLAGLLLLAWIAALVVLSQIVILKGFRTLEREDVELNVKRGLEGITSEMDTLLSVAGDWAPWDDAYAFALGKGPAFVADNITAKTLQNLELDFMVFLDGHRAPLYAMFIDRETGIETPAPAAVLRAIVGTDTLYSTDLKNPGTRGILDAGVGFPIMAASHQILRTDFSGPRAGWLVVGRNLDGEEVHRLGAVTRLDLTVVAAKDAPKSAGILVQPVDRGTAAGWSPIEDLQGKGGFSLRVLQPRTIFIQGQRTLLYFYAALGGMGVFFVVVVSLYLTGTLLYPLSRLSFAVTQLQPGREKDGVNFPARNDELGALARSVDGMLLQIAENRASLLEQSYSLGKAEVISEVLHGVRNTLTPMMGEIEMLAVRLDSIPERELKKALEELSLETTTPERRARLQAFLTQAVLELTGMVGEGKARLRAIGETAARVEEILNGQERWSHAARSAEPVAVGKVTREALVTVPDRSCIEISWKKSPEGMPTALANPILLRQVMAMLLQHIAMGAKARGASRTAIEVDGWVESTLEGSTAHVSVTDPAALMDPERARTMFKRESNSLPGLHMSWCANAMALMNGGINVAASDGRGVSFHLRLPA